MAFVGGVASTSSSSPAKEICVFLMNQTGVCVPVQEESKVVRAEDVITSLRVQFKQGVDIFRREQLALRFADTVDAAGAQRSSGSLASQLRPYFALWMTSPLLEVNNQLVTKIYHCLLILSLNSCHEASTPSRPEAFCHTFQVESAPVKIYHHNRSSCHRS